MDDLYKYHLALGAFIDRFAITEAAIQVTLWNLCKIELPVAQSIFSGTRTRTALEFIRRISEAKDLKLAPELEEAFSHLNAINTTRDKIVHFGSVAGSDGARIISNKFIAHTDRALHEFTVSPELLNQMFVSTEN